MNTENIDIQKNISFIKNVYMYIYTFIYIFVRIQSLFNDSLIYIHNILTRFPNYVFLHDKVMLYYNNYLFPNKKDEKVPMDMEKEMDNIVDIIKKLE
jgi:hypothetical protein